MSDGIGAWTGALRERLHGVGTDVSLLGLRLIMAYEFGVAGLEKLRGENWFAHVQDKFPPPLNLISADVSWFLATWTELIASAMLVLGLATRFWALVLLVLTGVAIASVHWPESWSSVAQLWQGYAITDQGFGNFKLPLLFALMLWPLVFIGPGRISLDEFFLRRIAPSIATSNRHGYDLVALALLLVVLGLPIAQVLPTFGYGLTLLGAVLCTIQLRSLRGAQRALP